MLLCNSFMKTERSRELDGVAFPKDVGEIRSEALDFHGGSVVKPLCSHCRGTGSIPGQGTKIPTCCTEQPKRKY